MADKRSRAESRVLARNQALEEGNQLEGKSEGDRTVIDLGADAPRRNTSDASANVLNLEFRSNTEIEIQTLWEYLGIHRELHTLGFEVKRRQRPRYPGDESCRNSKWRHEVAGTKAALTVTLHGPCVDRRSEGTPGAWLHHFAAPPTMIPSLSLRQRPRH